MPTWTKKAAISRAESNQELRQVYIRHPLARILVESAMKLKRHKGYHRIASHYAYKDWMWAATGHENKDYWTCIHVIDDLLPPDNGDLERGHCAYTDNPQLPDLPARPSKYEESPLVLGSKGKYVLKTLSKLELEQHDDSPTMRRRDVMRVLLEQVSMQRSEV